MYAERGPIIILYSAAPVFPAVRTWAYSVAGRYNTTLGRYCIGDKNPPVSPDDRPHECVVKTVIVVVIIIIIIVI